MSSITPLKSKHKVPLPGALLEQWNGIIFNFILLSYFLSFFETLIIKCVLRLCTMYYSIIFIYYFNT